jgi:hypothetical protein
MRPTPEGIGHLCGGQPQGRESGRRIEYKGALIWREVRADEGAGAVQTSLSLHRTGQSERL